MFMMLILSVVPRELLLMQKMIQDLSTWKEERFSGVGGLAFVAYGKPYCQ